MCTVLDSSKSTKVLQNKNESTLVSDTHTFTCLYCLCTQFMQPETDSALPMRGFDRLRSLCAILFHPAQIHEKTNSQGKL